MDVTAYNIIRDFPQAVAVYIKIKKSRGTMSEFFSFYGRLVDILDKICIHLQSREGLNHMAWIASELEIPFEVIYRAVCCDKGETLQTDGRNAWLNGTKRRKRAEYEKKMASQ